MRRLHAGTMPPQPARRPDAATYERLIGWLEGELDRAAAAAPNPGRPVLHRLNRAEYANAIRDVLAVDVDVASMLPPDDSAYGFDNISDVLGVSPSLQERYLTAAKKVSALAVGDTSMAAGSETYRIRQDLSQDQHLDGLPLGTIGGIQVRHTFPLDGEYTFQVKLYRTNLNIVRGLQYPHDVEFTVDGQRVHLATIGGKADLAAHVREADGYRRRRRCAAARARAGQGGAADGVGGVRPGSGGRGLGAAAGLRAQLGGQLRLGGPAAHADARDHRAVQRRPGPGDTPSRRRIFVCQPSRAERRTRRAPRRFSRPSRVARIASR